MDSSFASLGHLKRRRFAAELWRHGDLALAYQRATGSQAAPPTIIATAKRWLAEPLTQEYLKSEFEQLRSRMVLDQDRHAQEVCTVAYSDLGDIASWGPAGVTIKPSDTIPAHARRAIQSIKTTTHIKKSVSSDEETVLESKVEITLHPKIQALQLLHTMFDRGQTIRTHLESKLRDLAGLAAKYVPREQHAQYLAEVRMVMGEGGIGTSPDPDATDDAGSADEIY